MEENCLQIFTLMKRKMKHFLQALQFFNVLCAFRKINFQKGVFAASCKNTDVSQNGSQY